MARRHCGDEPSRPGLERRTNAATAAGRQDVAEVDRMGRMTAARERAECRWTVRWARARTEAKEAADGNAERLAWYIAADGSGGVAIIRCADADVAAVGGLEAWLALSEFIELESKVVLDLDAAMPAITAAIEHRPPSSARRRGSRRRGSTARRRRTEAIGFPRDRPTGRSEIGEGTWADHRTIVGSGRWREAWRSSCWWHSPDARPLTIHRPTTPPPRSRRPTRRRRWTRHRSTNREPSVSAGAPSPWSTRRGRVAR